MFKTSGLSITPIPSLLGRRAARSGWGTRLAVFGSVLLFTTSSFAFGPLDDVHLAGVSAKQANPNGATPGIDPTTGFPSYYVDQNGVALLLCTANTDPAGQCLFAPADDPTAPNFAYQQQIGFADEAFYWNASANLDMPPPAGSPCTDCRRGLVEMALEAAYTNGDAVPGTEFVFGRLRIWLDTPFAGHYKVTYPFGVEEFDAPAAAKGIRTTIDVGTSYPDFSGPLSKDNKIRNFLVWDGGTIGDRYIGDGITAHTVQGATHYEDDGSGNWQPFNKVRVELVCPSGDASCPAYAIETNLLTVQGRIFSGPVATPLAIASAIYYGGQSPTVSVNALSTPDATVRVGFDGSAPSTTLTGVNGDFQGTVTLAAGSRPKTVTVTAASLSGTASTLSVPVTDIVSIQDASYDLGTQILSLTANSTAQGGPDSPTLTVLGIGKTLTPPSSATGAYTLSLKIPPSSRLRVQSSLGGLDDRAIKTNGGTGTTPPSPTPNKPPVAVDDAVTAQPGQTIVIPVASNDTDPDGTVDVLSVKIGTQPAKGTLGPLTASGVTYTPSASFTTGTDTFTYTIADDQKALSNSATVTISVATENIQPTITQFKSGAWRIRGTTNVLPGNSMSAYLVKSTGAETLIGSGVLDATGAYDIRVNAPPAPSSTAGSGDTIRLQSRLGTSLPKQTISYK